MLTIVQIFTAIWAMGLALFIYMICSAVTVLAGYHLRSKTIFIHLAILGLILLALLLIPAYLQVTSGLEQWAISAVLVFSIMALQLLLYGISWFRGWLTRAA